MSICQCENTLDENGVMVRILERTCPVHGPDKMEANIPLLLDSVARLLSGNASLASFSTGWYHLGDVLAKIVEDRKSVYEISAKIRDIHMRGTLTREEGLERIMLYCEHELQKLRQSR